MYDKKINLFPSLIRFRETNRLKWQLLHLSCYGVWHPNKQLQIRMKNTKLPVFSSKGKANGTVVDQTGEPLIGVSVKVKDAPNGTITNLDGKFSIDVAKGATLEISYVGYKTVIVKAESTPMHIVLKEDSEMIDEVVVVGYGSQKRLMSPVP